MDNSLKQRILISMISFAENPQKYDNAYETAGIIDAVGQKINIRGFAPTLADKFLFKEIIKSNEKRIDQKYPLETQKKHLFFAQAIGLHLMGLYYSSYGLE